MIGPVLGVETSCDETSAAVLGPAGEVLSLIIHSQDVHRVYGGVVPELAARDHLRRIEPVVARALEEAGTGRRELAAIAVTAGPGLIGALLVGVSWARAAAFSLNIPLVPVHHMEGHLFGPVLETPDAHPPFVALLVSGGHTQLIWVPEWGRYFLMGQTRDDAAGEAFDKVGKLLGLPYPGGPAIESAAARGDPARFRFPRPMLRSTSQPGDPDHFDFSFSGLKTAVAQTAVPLLEASAVAEERDDLAASFQQAAVDVLVGKTMRAVETIACRRVLLGGGVSANRALRVAMEEALGPEGRLFVGSPRVSMDNGAMIARAGQFRLASGIVEDFGGGARAAVPIPGMLPWSPARPHN